MSRRARAMILAAGRGERMRPLTDTCPKPLLEVHGKPLIQYHLDAMSRAGFRDVVVNTGWLGHMLEARLGLHPAAGLTVHYSHERAEEGGPFETAGGVARALPLLDDVFWLAGGDVHVPGFAFSLPRLREFAAGDALVHMWLVPNRPHHPKGDFGIDEHGYALPHADTLYTYSTLGLYRREFFSSIPEGNPDGVKVPMLPLFRAAMENRQVTAEVYRGPWADVGTPQRLAELNE